MISAKELLEARACTTRNPIAQIEQAHVFSPVNSSDGADRPTESPSVEEKTPIKKTVVFEPKSIGKRYIKHPEFTNPPMG